MAQNRKNQLKALFDPVAVPAAPSRSAEPAPTQPVEPIRRRGRAAPPVP